MTGTYVNSREPNPAYTQAGILKQITYPTGGRTVFTYEQNDAYNVYLIPTEGTVTGRTASTEKEYFGGVRIAKIENYTDGNNPAEVKRYVYDDAVFVPIEKKNFFINQSIMYWAKMNRDPISSETELFCFDTAPWIFEASTVNTFLEPGAQSIVYGTVTEYVGESSAVNGKNVYSFRKTRYYPELYSLQWGNGNPLFDAADEEMYSLFHNFDKGVIPVLLEKKQVYEYKNGVDILRREEINNYSAIMRDSLSIVGLDIENKNHFINSNTGAYEVTVDLSPVFRYRTEYYSAYYDDLRVHPIYGVRAYDQLTSVTVKEYLDIDAAGNQQGEMVTTTTYGYDPMHRIKSPIRTQTTNSNGHILSQSLTYPFNHTGTVYANMTQKNIISPVISKVTQDSLPGNNPTAIQALFNHYKPDGYRFVPDKLSLGRSLSALEDRVTYHAYDAYSNPAHISKDGITNVVYIWGYKGEKLIAMIENATLADVTSKLNGATLDDIADASNPTSYITRIKNLRNGSTLPADVFVTTYTYDPLFGVTEISDPRGMLTLHSYDSQGRLVKISQKVSETAAEEILETYQYHYRN